jgi:two-component system, NarL family, sensor histidine kinase DegS
MVQAPQIVMTRRRLLLFKWLMIFLPSSTVALGHSLIQHSGDGTHGQSNDTATLLVTIIGLILTYLFVEMLFRIVRELQKVALAREQDIQAMSAVMQERARLSRELHDGVAQLVAHLLLRLDTIGDLVENNRQKEAKVELERLREVGNEIYLDIGESISGLRANLAEQGLVRALQDYIDQFEERHQIPTSLRTDGTAKQLSPVAALQVFRFIQEALSNIRKHAEAHAVTVVLMGEGAGQLKIVIADDGQGFIAGSQRNSKVRPLGLTSMRERIELLGGSFQLNSQPGSGTEVTATIPIPQKRSENKYAALTPSAR